MFSIYQGYGDFRRPIQIGQRGEGMPQITDQSFVFSPSDDALVANGGLKSALFGQQVTQSYRAGNGVRVGSLWGRINRLSRPLTTDNRRCNSHY
jgi:hypothetical protein